MVFFSRFFGNGLSEESDVFFSQVRVLEVAVSVILQRKDKFDVDN